MIDNYLQSTILKLWQKVKEYFVVLEPLLILSSASMSLYVELMNLCVGLIKFPFFFVFSLQQQVSSMRLLSGAPYNIYIYIYIFFFLFFVGQGGESYLVRMVWLWNFVGRVQVWVFMYLICCLLCWRSFLFLAHWNNSNMFYFLKVTPSSLYIVKVIDEFHMNFILTKLKLRLT